MERERDVRDKDVRDADISDMDTGNIDTYDRYTDEIELQKGNTLGHPKICLYGTFIYLNIEI